MGDKVEGERHRVRHLYLHVPFCARVCPYCAFYVHRGGVEQQRAFVGALLRELEQLQQRYEWGAVETIFIGGGTPSLLSAELFAQVAAALPVGAVVETTLEVNPATVTPAKMKAWRVAGVNRVSLGVQSFDASYLKLLGRQHTPEEAEETVRELRAYGFNNLNIDLMFALPGQDPAQWLTTLERTVRCGTEHVSCYGLTVESDTPFFEQVERGLWAPNMEREAVMFAETARVLEAAGLLRYEVSNFARPGYESRHNQAYWQGEDYLGVGPSAVSTVAGRRWKNVADTAAYIERVHGGQSLETEVEEITPAIKQHERLMLGLRTRQGVPWEWVMHKGGQMRMLLEEGLARVEAEEGGGKRFRLTERGLLVADDVAAIFS